MSDPYNATITRIDEFNEYLAVFHIKPDEGEVPAFEPGQFTTLGLIDPQAEPKIGKDGQPKPKLIKRAYSIGSSSGRRDQMEFFIILVEDGALTPLLWKVGVGGRIWMSSKISGDFTLESVPDGKDLVLVSTGTGLAPYISMMRRYHAERRWNRWVIINGVRYAKDFGYVDELRAMEAAHDDLVYLPLATRDDTWTGLKGRVPTILEPEAFRTHAGAPLDPDQSHVFLCGNPQMIDDVEAGLLDRGFTTHKKREPGNIHLERYW